MDQIRSRAVVAVFMVLLAGLSAALWLLLRRHAETEYIPLSLADDGE